MKCGDAANLVEPQMDITKGKKSKKYGKGLQKFEERKSRASRRSG